MASCEVALDGAETLSLCSIKLKGWDGSEITPSEYPALTANNFGSGRAIYMAGIFGGLYWNYKQLDIRVLLGNLMKSLTQAWVRLSNAPISVEVAHRETEDREAELIHLINYSGGATRPFESIQTLDNIEIQVRSERKSAALYRISSQSYSCRTISGPGYRSTTDL